MFDRMAKWAVGVSIVALITAIGGMVYNGTVRIDGAISGWISGIGSLASALAALGIALWNDLKDRRDRGAIRAESRERAVRRAKRVQVRQTASLQTSITTVGLYIENTTSAPLYELRWYPPVVVIPTQAGQRRTVVCDTAAETRYKSNTEANVLAALPRVLGSGDSYGIRTDVHTLPELHTLPANVQKRLSYLVHPVVAFEDEDGYRFGRTPTGTVGSEDHDDDLIRRWELVDDEWPWKCGGALRELFNQVKGWAPGAPGG
jgi:hypothetical protein